MTLYQSMLSLALAAALSIVGVMEQSFADTSAGVSVNTSFDSNWFEHLQPQAETIVLQGATPLITWMPYKQATSDANILDQIISGQQDAYVERWLNDFKLWLSHYDQDQQPNIALRFAPELYETESLWNSSPSTIKAAWRYLHNQFAAAGVNDSVEWVWDVNNVNWANYDDITDHFPGDDVVDWLAIEGDDQGNETGISHQQSFDQTSSQIYAKAVKRFPKKPIMITKGHDNKVASQNQARWVSSMKGLIKEDYPAITSIAWFNAKQELGWVFHVEEPIDTAMRESAVSDDAFNESVNIAPNVSSQAATVLNTTSIDQTRKPEVVGREALAREARGLRQMDEKILRKWRLESILPK